MTLLFLLIGTGLAHFYQSPPAYDISDEARILPLFALHELPAGMRGLLFAGLFAAAMSSLDSAICAIATTWASDVVRTAPGAGVSTRTVRWASVVVTVLLIGAAIGMAKYHALLTHISSARAAAPGPNLVEFALSSMTILYGGLLGIFAVGLLTRTRGSETSVAWGLGIGGAVGLLLFLHPLLLGETVIAWTWWIPLSSTITFAIAASGRSQTR
jgi:Na+/proline symporter